MTTVTQGGEVMVEERSVATPHLAVFGGPLDTGNLGVSALGLSTLAAVARRTEARVTLFDNGSGVRAESLVFHGSEVAVDRRGAWLSRRLHRPESLWQMLASSTLAGGRFNSNVEALRTATEVWDISGGDSFSDIYGDKRFLQIALAKQIALQQSRLVLLPQTYGPFRSPRNRAWARRIVLRADEAWARDGDSLDRLRDLAGDDFDPERHRESVDVAFTLPVRRPPAGVLGHVGEWLDDDRPVAGINVSGLLGSESAHHRFGLRADHETAVARTITRLVADGARVLLVPHVQGSAAESDSQACRRLAAATASDTSSDVAVLPDGLDATETKWVVSRLAWMTGARMHATIAALSSTTPVTGIAYSDKMRGVFASCGIGDQVADVRALETGELVDALVAGFRDREAIGKVLRSRVPDTVATAEATFDYLAGRLRGEGA